MLDVFSQLMLRSSCQEMRDSHKRARTGR